MSRTGQSLSQAMNTVSSINKSSSSSGGGSTTNSLQSNTTPNIGNVNLSAPVSSINAQSSPPKVNVQSSWINQYPGGEETAPSKQAWEAEVNRRRTYENEMKPRAVGFASSNQVASGTPSDMITIASPQLQGLVGKQINSDMAGRLTSGEISLSQTNALNDYGFNTTPGSKWTAGQGARQEQASNKTLFEQQNQPINIVKDKFGDEFVYGTMGEPKSPGKTSFKAKAINFWVA
jgi:hypothetical protein